MKVVDLNILLYAINSDLPHHQKVLNWWNAAMNEEEPIGFSCVVLLGFLRISTNPQIFPKPLEPSVAIKVVDRWLAQPNARLLVEREEHWLTLKGLLLEAGTAANLVIDTHLASIAITHGAVIVSCDSDFARFEGLRWENPLA